MDYSHYDFLDVAVHDGGICVIRLNRPGKLNACTVAEHEELPRILRDVQRDPDVKVLVITGNGRAFSVGGDFELLERANRNHGDELPDIMRVGREIVLAHVDLEKPVICAINGYMMGAGMAFGLFSDVIIAERSARISDGHIRAAIAAGDGGVLIWPISMGLAKAKWYLMTGDWITAEEAERFGLITEVVDDGTSFDRAMQIARRFAAGPQLAITYTKRALNQWLRDGVAKVYDTSALLEGLTFVSEDASNAIRMLRETGRGVMPGPNSFPPPDYDAAGKGSDGHRIQ